LPTPEWGPAYRKKHTPEVNDDDDPAAAAAADGSDSGTPHGRHDDIEMKFAKSPNGGVGVESINPSFIEDNESSPRSDGDGSSRAMVVANGIFDNVPYSRMNRAGRDISEGRSSSDDGHSYVDAAL